MRLHWQPIMRWYADERSGSAGLLQVAIISNILFLMQDSNTSVDRYWSLNPISSIQKIPAIPKIQGRYCNYKCHAMNQVATITKKKLKAFKIIFL